MELPARRSNDDRRRPLPIGVTAATIGITPATLRLWEKKGLVSPARRGKNRCYSHPDLERLKEIKRLLGERRMNIAGARAILDQSRCWDVKSCGERKETCPVYIRQQASQKE